ncbi:protein gar2-like [Teleopsis dalmanni]|uniref:protein gar2-like n=1 Tax=Teleopsis dalmanni TaxID=139649 RepID=UPI000D32CAFA|nr:protein gar2-like [Teleopsis dalmanni]
MDIGKRKSLMSPATQRKVAKRIKALKLKRCISSHFSTDDEKNSSVNTSGRHSQSSSNSVKEDVSKNKSTKRKHSSHRSSVSSGSSTSETGSLSNSSGSSSNTSNSSNSESSSASQLSEESSSSDDSSIETGQVTKNSTPSSTTPKNCDSEANRSAFQSILSRSKISINKIRRTVTMSRNASSNTCNNASNSSTSGSEDGSRTTARRSIIRLTKRTRRLKSTYSIGTDSSSNSLSSTTSKMVSYSSSKSSSSTDESVHPQRRKRCANYGGPASTSLKRYGNRLCKYNVSQYKHANKGYPKRKNSRKNPKPNKRIVVFGLSPLTGVLNLRLLFQQYGKIRYVKIIKDRLTTRSRGFAFIKFKHKSDAQKAVARSQNMNINGWIVRPTFSLN